MIDYVLGIDMYVWGLKEEGVRWDHLTSLNLTDSLSEVLVAQNCIKKDIEVFIFLLKKFIANFLAVSVEKEYISRSFFPCILCDQKLFCCKWQNLTMSKGKINKENFCSFE